MRAVASLTRRPPRALSAAVGARHRCSSAGDPGPGRRHGPAGQPRRGRPLRRRARRPAAGARGRPARRRPAAGPAERYAARARRRPRPPRARLGRAAPAAAGLGADRAAAARPPRGARTSSTPRTTRCRSSTACHGRARRSSPCTTRRSSAIPQLHLGVKARFFRLDPDRRPRRADALVVPSGRPRTRSSRHAGADPDRIAVVPHGVDHDRFRPPTPAEVDRGPRRGSGWPGPAPTSPSSAPSSRARTSRRSSRATSRRAATAPTRRPSSSPGAAAGTTASTRRSREVPDRLTVLRPGFVPDGLVPALLGGAEVVAYPAFGEGFGLPVLEAMACGAAVLTTRRPVAARGRRRRRGATRGQPGRRRPRRRPRPSCSTTRRAAAPAGRPRIAAGRPRYTWDDRGAVHVRRLRAGGRRMTRGLPHRSALVVVTYFPGDFLEAFLDSLVRPRRRRPVPVTVVDNGSTDGTRRRRCARRPGARAGGDRDATSATARAANVGVAAAGRGVGPRRQPRHRLRARRRRRAARRRRALAAGRRPRSADPHRRRAPLPVRARAAVARAGHRSCPLRLGLAVEPVDRRLPSRARSARRGDGRLAVRGVPAAATRGVRRRSAGFDEGYFMYFEDTDLCERLAKAGWDVVYAPSATVVHHGGHATVAAPGTRCPGRTTTAPTATSRAATRGSGGRRCGGCCASGCGGGTSSAGASPGSSTARNPRGTRLVDLVDVPRLPGPRERRLGREAGLRQRMARHDVVQLGEDLLQLTRRHLHGHHVDEALVPLDGR